MISEADTRANLIDPKLVQQGWIDNNNTKVIREYTIAYEKIKDNKKSREYKKADYLLIYKNIKLAIIEAKSSDLSYHDAVLQAKDYAIKLNLRFTFATNGKEIAMIDLKENKTTMLQTFPTPDELFNMTYTANQDILIALSKVPNLAQFTLRYYQINAVEAVLKAISEGRKRILLTLATGTGKTKIATEIINKIFYAKYTLEGLSKRAPRILFLADRNILADQANNDFQNIDNGQGAVIRLKPESIKNKIHTESNIYITIFQTLMADEAYKKYPNNFFDFIIIDECHRGGANDESSWRDILNHFSEAIQLGLTATPKRKDNANTYNYFGEPVYVYSLKEGINDGYLTPFRVRSISDNFETYQYDESDDIEGGEIDKDRVYKKSEFNKIIQIKEKEQKRVEFFLNEIDQSEKTLVFCANVEHAGLIAELINNIQTISKDPLYCARVTFYEGSEGEELLRDFQQVDKTIPTILTTSQKLTTGVDAIEIRNIILLRPVNNIIEFKQIIGRGTRLCEGKNYFTIYDFVNASKNFEDPEWDGETVFLDYPSLEKIREGATKDNDIENNNCESDEYKKRELIKVTLGENREIDIYDNGTLFYDPKTDKMLSARDFISNLIGIIPNFFNTEKELRDIWKDPDTRESLLKNFEDFGYSLDDGFKKIQELLKAHSSDIFDVLEYIAGYNNSIISRKERVDYCLNQIKDKYEDRQLEFIKFVLEEYRLHGIKELFSARISDLIKIKYKTLSDASRHMNIEARDIRILFNSFQEYLYVV